MSFVNGIILVDMRDMMYFFEYVIKAMVPSLIILY